MREVYDGLGDLSPLDRSRYNGKKPKRKEPQFSMDDTDKGQVTIRYFGRNANAHREKVRKASIEALRLRIVEDQSLPIPAKGWAEMIRA
jgi:hypothetical protein